ncbi:unnamed protein product [Effrenium voratum]|uniref:Uncharacterized protein n=1 Tax=Effrenium voratum TaxID=2562239 RepID=A0AA36N931_9DINO|nr:unnamed protein product [Effrenium voratum]
MARALEILEVLREEADAAKLLGRRGYERPETCSPVTWVYAQLAALQVLRGCRVFADAVTAMPRALELEAGAQGLTAQAARHSLGKINALESSLAAKVAFPGKAQALAFLDSGDRHSIAISFLDVRPRGLLTPLSFDESNEAEDKAALVASKVEQAAEAADEAEVQAEAAEEAELIVVGIATVFAGVAWYTTYVTWQTYQRWLNMKKRAALCVGAARAANAVS